MSKITTPAARERDRERSRAWHEKNRAHATAYQRNYRKRNPEKVREINRVWRADNPDYLRRWRETNTDKTRDFDRVSNGKRRASIKTSTSEAPTAQQLTSILKNPCRYCGAPAEHVDHFIPLARGGLHTLDNLVPACAPCNLSKGSKLPGTEWKGRTGYESVLYNRLTQELRAATELVRSKLGSKDDGSDD